VTDSTHLRAFHTVRLVRVGLVALSQSGPLPRLVTDQARWCDGAPAKTGAGGIHDVFGFSPAL
jgi:hypothetical protein